ncbi:MULTISPECIES: UDP-glucose dehydrogenase family protein [Geobacter]|uniref:UDP-glucose dehydrogenase family protein n=1 Tax=Geobacter TaxID=28231 RepID=UPI002572C6EC|nr:UDP-glucose/GDP-mannose dehydrogenase family protein [Geobacter sulfurreducens]BEH10188.1 UDP-glucose/GDP-mannose dehydrogenase family protein [Geobacter sulfurreducens subsp. ethanolicus]BET58226.1 UDP-glucose/GDP-mannose dehydrogenase family protein [Geobacter sp. 60473]HML78161.1 UDP-glucose/GDP-mannose dehydrogenase family protein [Geobacter sulfurreducens]
MKICVIGTGYVGLVAGTCFAESGNTVVCVDVNEEKIAGLREGVIPIYEPGLKEMVIRNSAEGRLTFTTDLAAAVKTSLVNFIAVGTPPGEDGSADLKYVLDVARAIGSHMEGFKIIVDKSTVPVGTADQVRRAVQEELDRRGVSYEFDVVSNPEFLKEGAAIDDFMKPDRVVIGVDNVRTAELMKELYSPFMRKTNRMILMDVRSAEMTKYAANAMLATRISFMNQIANLCERMGADVSAVREGIGSDSRIGYDFLFPGVGYGGSCFPKDVKALVRTAEECGYDFMLLKAVEEVNERQKMLIPEKILRHFAGDGAGESRPLAGKTIAVWGLSFKPRTDDMREAPSIVVIERLLAEGASVRAHDPEAVREAQKIFGDRIAYSSSSPYDILAGADALAIVTEWNEYRNPDFERIAEQLKTPVIFDGRNLYNPRRLKEMGFIYHGIGRNGSGFVEK